jgi:hypothetical protein
MSGRARTGAQLGTQVAQDGGQRLARARLQQPVHAGHARRADRRRQRPAGRCLARWAGQGGAGGLKARSILSGLRPPA